MKKRQMMMVLLCMALSVSLCACTQEQPEGTPAPSSSPVVMVQPSPGTPQEPDEEEDFLLPVYSNTMAGGCDDLYAVTEDGTLLMWGKPEFTWGLRGGDLGGEPIVLMENISAIYTSFRGAVMAVDRNGTLWQFDVLEGDPYEPVWIIDDVTMVSAEFMRTLILKRDGTLYEWEFSNRNSQRPVSIPSPVVYAASGAAYSCCAVTADGTLWEWNFGPEGFAPVVREENVDWVQYRYGLNDDGSRTAWDGAIIPNVVQVSRCWAVQEDGTLWHLGDARESLAPRVIMGGVKQAAASEYGLLVLKEDGTYWYSDFKYGNFGYGESHCLEFTCVYEDIPLPKTT